MNRSNIKFWREKRGWSLTELAKMVGVNRKTLYLYENGAAANCDAFLRIAKALKVKPELLWEIDCDEETVR